MKRSFESINIPEPCNQNRNKIRRYFRVIVVIVALLSFVRAEAQVKKTKPANGAKHINVKKDSVIAIIKSEPLFSKGLTADKINIDTRIKPIAVQDFSVTVYHPLIGAIRCFSGSYLIVVGDWQKTGLPLRVLFKY